MAAAPFTATGSKVYIGPAQAAEPANAAAYAALTWTEIKMVENIGEYGDEANEITAATLGDGRVRKAKGARNSGSTPLVVFPDGSDAGQSALIAAQLTQDRYPFKIDLPNKITTGGTDELNYFMALVRSQKKNVGNNDNVVRDTFALSLDSKVTYVAAT